MVFGRRSHTPSGPDKDKRRQRPRKAVRAGALVLAAGVLAACQADEFGAGPKHLRPVSESIKRKMTDLNMSSTSPIMIRIFKEESELEVWKQTRNGKYKKLEEFEICKWSGKLGPKFKEGDRQAHDQGQEGGHRRPFPAAGLLVDGVEGGGTGIMKEAEQHEVHRGERGPSTGPEEIPGPGEAQLEHHSGLAPDPGDPTYQGR